MSFRSTLIAATALPYKRRLQYLESTGTQWIDTGIVPNQSTVVEADVFLPSVIDYHEAFGARKDTSTMYEIIVYGNRFYTQYGNGNMYFATGRFLEKFIHIKLDANKVYIDGELIYTHAIQTFDCGYPMTLFCRNIAGTKDRFGNGVKIKSLSIKQDGTTLSRDFVPAFNGEPGMYDKVTNQMFYNAGSGTFLYE